MMENVPGLVKTGAIIFNLAMNELSSLGYNISHEILDVADYGVPQRRRRLVVLGSQKSTISIPKPTHASTPSGKLKPWATVRQAIKKFDKPLTLQDSLRNGSPISADWHVVRNLSIENKERLRVISQGTSRANIPQHLRPKCHQNKNQGFPNVYGRMSWDKPSPTITGGCTTLSKGRFGHPSQLRTISVREASILQTFPKNYFFDTNEMEHVCDIIGNALPPKFAARMASACFKTLKGA
jgi:DNA (cytosine-5)-methyltransferase 1